MRDGKPLLPASAAVIEAAQPLALRFYGRRRGGSGAYANADKPRPLVPDVERPRDRLGGNILDLPEPVADADLEAVLRDALRIGGGRITRERSLEMAEIVAEHLVKALAVAGIGAVRVPHKLPLTD